MFSYQQSKSNYQSCNSNININFPNNRLNYKKHIELKPKSKNVLMRKCECSNSSTHQGECEECKMTRLSLQRKPMNFLQPKLTINSPDDIYEKEADEAADKVMQMKIPELNLANVKRRAYKDEQIQRKADSGEISTDSLTLVNEVISSPGKSLDEETRAFMEPRFGYDFSRVRIFNDNKAAESAAAVSAVAYTIGNNIVFNKGQFNPSTYVGKNLLGHELTHVVQQNENLIRRQALPAQEESIIVCRYSLEEAERIETQAALETLNLSGRVASGFLRTVGAVSARGRFIPTVVDNKYWFAKLYELITYHEIAERHKFQYPAFVMHFIPIFYSMYYSALMNYFDRKYNLIHEKWLIHFRSTDRRSRSTSISSWMNEIVNSIDTGVSAHIRGDMAAALELAFTSYKNRYCLQNAAMDIYRRDFFETNRKIFEIVKASFFIELSRFSPSPLSTEMTQFIFGVGDRAVSPGLSIDEIYKWRNQAWMEALNNLSLP